MRTRLQMTPEEARYSRETLLCDMNDLARFAGAVSPSAADITTAIRLRWYGRLALKEAIVPRTEKWRLDLRRVDGGWSVAGRMTQPEVGPVIDGAGLPPHVRRVFPVSDKGLLPASLAPAKELLPRVAPGVWRGTSRRAKRGPTVNLDIDAPRWGICVFSTGSPLGLVPVRFPVHKTRFRRILERLSREALAIDAATVNAHNEKRRLAR